MTQPSMYIHRANIEVTEETERISGPVYERVLVTTRWMAKHEGPVRRAEDEAIVSYATFSRDGRTYTEALENLLQYAKDQGMLAIL
jgi:hypothetical protein